jgi:hypothetical protein
LACLKLHILLTVLARPTVPIPVPAQSIAVYQLLAKITTLRPVANNEEELFMLNVFEELPLTYIVPVPVPPPLDMNAFALLQEADKVVVVLLLQERPPAFCVGPELEGVAPRPLETLQVQEYYSASLTGKWLPLWSVMKKGKMVYMACKNQT